MHRPFVAVKAKKKAVNVVTVAKNIMTQRKKLDRATTDKILKRYLSMAKSAVLAGYEWKFPGPMEMSLCVFRKITGGPAIDNNFTGQKTYIASRPGEQYTIELQSDFVKSRKYKFIVDHRFKKELQNILTTTNKEYRLEPMTTT